MTGDRDNSTPNTRSGGETVPRTVPLDRTRFRYDFGSAPYKATVLERPGRTGLWLRWWDRHKANWRHRRVRETLEQLGDEGVERIAREQSHQLMAANPPAPEGSEIDGKFAEDPHTGCWNWTGALTKGYGRIKVGGRTRIAHRVVYERLVGPIPEGLHLDHLCVNPRCIRPEHLEPVTTRENNRRVFIRREARASAVASITEETGTA